MDADVVDYHSDIYNYECMPDAAEFKAGVQAAINGCRKMQATYINCQQHAATYAATHMITLHAA